MEQLEERGWSDWDKYLKNSWTQNQSQKHEQTTSALLPSYYSSGGWHHLVNSHPQVFPFKASSGWVKDLTQN
jgi:hypothetical protein